MGLVQLDQVLEDYVQRNPLPALFGGVILGILLALLAMFVVRMAKGRRLVGMIKELKERNHHLTTANQDLKKEVERFQGQIKGLERENELLNDRVKNHDGHINALKERIAELSSDCERLRTDSIEIREKFRKEKKILSEIQEVARRYSEQLDSIAQSDGKLWLGSSSSGQSVQFLPLPNRLAAAIISVAHQGWRGQDDNDGQPGGRAGQGGIEGPSAGPRLSELAYESLPLAPRAQRGQAIAPLLQRSSCEWRRPDQAGPSSSPCFRPRRGVASFIWHLSMRTLRMSKTS